MSAIGDRQYTGAGTIFESGYTPEFYSGKEKKGKLNPDYDKVLLIDCENGRI